MQSYKNSMAVFITFSLEYEYMTLSNPNTLGYSFAMLINLFRNREKELEVQLVLPYFR